MAAQENHVDVVRCLLLNQANQTLATEVRVDLVLIRPPGAIVRNRPLSHRHNRRRRKFYSVSRRRRRKTCMAKPA